jgi:type IV pilus assembly protein PilA
MSRRSACRQAGFTLVELMIVVAIIGVLAALAIYGVARYLKHSKVAEANRSLGTIVTGESVQFQVETVYGGSGGTTQTFYHQFCPSDGPVPSTGIPRASKVSAPTGDYATAGWSCLRFNLTSPQYYQYSVTTNSATGTAASYTAYAYGDLDGNGTNSTFYVVGLGGPTGDAYVSQRVTINEDE